MQSPWDEQGHHLGTRTAPNTPEGWATALVWAREQQQPMRCWGLENSGSLGKGFAQFLLAQGETAVRAVRLQRTVQYRRRGRTQDKTDHADALASARLLLAAGALLPRVQRDDASTALRLLRDHHDWECPLSTALPPFRCLKRAGAARKRDLARPSGNRQSLIWADIPAAKP